MILGYKGFKPGLIATLGDGSYQYQPGEVSRTDKAKCASTGFHYCLDPLDCLNWYPWDGQNEIWAVAAGGDIDEDDCGTRSSCTEIIPLRRLNEDEGRCGPLCGAECSHRAVSRKPTGESSVHL